VGLESTAGAQPLANAASCTVGVDSSKPNQLTVSVTNGSDVTGLANYDVQVVSSPNVSTENPGVLTDPVATADNVQNKTIAAFTVAGLTATKNYVVSVLAEGAAPNLDKFGGPYVVCTPNPAGPIPGPVVSGQAPPETFGTADAVITRHFEEFLGRDPNFTERIFWDNYFENNSGAIGSCHADSSTAPPQGILSADPTSPVGPWCPNSGPEFDLIQFLTNGSTGSINPPIGTDATLNTLAGSVYPIIRLYTAYFNRIPDYKGLGFWASKYVAGTGIDAISEKFAASSEFKHDTGGLSDADFISFCYENVLGTLPDIGGEAFWLAELANGEPRGWVMTRFSESSQNKAQQLVPVTVEGLFAALLRRVPTPTEATNAESTISDLQHTGINGSGTYNLSTSLDLWFATLRNSPAYTTAAGKAITISTPAPQTAGPAAPAPILLGASK
jgi:hypothetical protein